VLVRRSLVDLLSDGPHVATVSIFDVSIIDTSLPKGSAVPRTLQRGGIVIARSVLVVTSAVTLLAIAVVLVTALIHLGQLRMLGEISATLFTSADDALGTIPPGARDVVVSASTEVQLSGHGTGVPFVAWQTAAWASRYGLAVVILGSVVHLCWRLGRHRGVGSVAPWWAAALGLASIAVAVFSPWALAHADQLVVDALALPTDGGASDVWFVVPGWSLQNTDPWLVLFGGLLALLGLLLHGARRAETDAEGLI
jgi:hypothetical protein